MSFRLPLLAAALLACPALAAADSPRGWWSDDVAQALVRAKDNRPQLEKALADVPKDQRKGMAFLIANMPEGDLKTLQTGFLLSNCELAYKAKKEVPWGASIPEAVFLNNVLPYANVDEKRDAWRQEFYDLCLPMVKGCKTPSEAVTQLEFRTLQEAPRQILDRA